MAIKFAKKNKNDKNKKKNIQSFKRNRYSI